MKYSNDATLWGLMVLGLDVITMTIYFKWHLKYAITITLVFVENDRREGPSANIK